MAVEQIRPVRDAGYYFEEPSLTVPTYQGNLSKILGIEGQPITAESFNQLFAGYSPDGVRLPKYMREDRRGALEVTVNMPKCASVLGQLAGDSRIGGVLNDVAGEVAAYLQKESCVRVSKGEFKGMDRKPDNLAWSVFTHPASRAGDPHLHAHVVFFNLSYDRAEKTYKAVETGYVDQKQMGVIANRAMMKGLRQLGYKVQEKGKEFEIVGVPAEVKAEFSSRHSQIKEIERNYATASPKAKGKLSLYHRPEKAVKPPEERKETWLTRITHDQFSHLADLVKRARDAVRKSRMKRNLNRFIDRSRQMEHSHELGLGLER